MAVASTLQIFKTHLPSQPHLQGSGVLPPTVFQNPNTLSLLLWLPGNFSGYEQTTISSGAQSRPSDCFWAPWLLLLLRKGRRSTGVTSRLPWPRPSSWGPSTRRCSRGPPAAPPSRGCRPALPLLFPGVLTSSPPRITPCSRRWVLAALGGPTPVLSLWIFLVLSWECWFISRKVVLWRR